MGRDGSGATIIFKAVTPRMFIQLLQIRLPVVCALQRVPCSIVSFDSAVKIQDFANFAATYVVIVPGMHRHFLGFNYLVARILGLHRDFSYLEEVDRLLHKSGINRNAHLSNFILQIVESHQSIVLSFGQCGLNAADTALVTLAAFGGEQDQVHEELT